jgi:Zn-dependent metalloprotease
MDISQRRNNLSKSVPKKVIMELCQVCEIVPQIVLVKLLEKEKNPNKKLRLLNHIKQSAALRSKRAVAYNYRGVRTAIADNLRRVLNEKNIHFYDCKESHDLPAKTSFEINERYQGRKKKGKVVKRKMINTREIANMDKVYDFWHENFERESFDAKSAIVKYYANYGKNYDNAFWDGENLTFGLGDPSYFNPFGKFIDVQAHEFGHAVIQYEADLVYQGQPGALNEHVADVFGITIRHWVEGKDVNAASWLLAEGLWKLQGYKALRDMASPGSAHPDDNQPAHMSNFYKGQEDNGGVHINSGIPNKAFFEFATRTGGNSWEKPLRIWYQTVKDQRLTNPNTNFEQFATATYDVAKKKYDDDTADLLRDSWNSVGIVI